MVILTIAIVGLQNISAQQAVKYTEHSSRISISPNPAQGSYFVVETDSSVYDHFERLLVYNSNGFLMQNKQLQINKGSSRQQIDISGYAPGNYIIRIIDLKDPEFSYATQLLVN